MKDSARTLAQQIPQEGRREGKLEGKLEDGLEELREAILDSLATRFACVPEGVKEAVRKIDSGSRLRALRQASLRAESLDAFAENLWRAFGKGAQHKFVFLQIGKIPSRFRTAP